MPEPSANKSIRDAQNGHQAWEHGAHRDPVDYKTDEREAQLLREIQLDSTDMERRRQIRRILLNEYGYGKAKLDQMRTRQEMPEEDDIPPFDEEEE